MAQLSACKRSSRSLHSGKQPGNVLLLRLWSCVTLNTTLPCTEQLVSHLSYHLWSYSSWRVPIHSWQLSMIEYASLISSQHSKPMESFLLEHLKAYSQSAWQQACEVSVVHICPSMTAGRCAWLKL